MKRQFKLGLECTNAAFDDENELREIARILRIAADRVERGELASGMHRNLHDQNGNPVGTFVLYGDRESDDA